MEEVTNRERKGMMYFTVDTVTVVINWNDL